MYLSKYKINKWQDVTNWGKSGAKMEKSMGNFGYILLIIRGLESR